MAKAKQKKNIEYHPEFLYFNDFVRRNNFYPEKHELVWNDQEGLSPYGVFNWVLENVVLLKGERPVSNLIQQFVVEGVLPKIDKDLDCTPWLEFAYSIDFENKVDLYSEVIFKFFGTVFDLPPFKISPFRLSPCKTKLYNSLLAGGYSFGTIMRADPACYYPHVPMIYMPLSEKPQKLPLGLYDEIVIHEILHVPTRIFQSFGIVADDLLISERSPSLWAFQYFGELLSNIGSIRVLKKAGTFQKKDLEKITETIIKQRAISLSGISQQAAIAMFEVPFAKWCEILSPVFSLYREIEFLLAERRRIQDASEKKLEGILRKKYQYNKSIKGKSKKQIRDEVAKRSASEFKALFSRLKEMDLRRFLSVALAKERSSRQRRSFETLLELFSEDNKSAWPPL